jgi:cytochrome P450
MNATYTLLLGLLIFIIFYILHSRNAQKATPLPIHRSFDPFVAFDVQLKNQLDPTSLLRQHARHGTTFQMTPMVAKPIVYTVAPENLKEIMTKGNDFGVEPLRGESMRPFCGRGFLTSDGDAWMESRRMVKPSFGKRNIEDLGALDSSIEELGGEIAKSGGSVDLQPLLFDMVGFRTFPDLRGC